MGIFDNKDILKKIKDIEKILIKFEESREVSDKKILSIESSILEVSKKSPDFEKEARQSSRMTSQYRNKAKETLDQSTLILENINNIKKESDVVFNEFSNKISDLKDEYSSLSNTTSDIEMRKDEVFSMIEAIETKLEEVDNIYKKHPDFEDEILNIDEFVGKIKSSENKTSILLKSISSRKQDIDRLHNEIIGYTETNEDSEEEDIYINGLKDDLEEAYEGLDERINSLATSIDELSSSSQQKYEVFLDRNETNSNDLIEGWKEKYTTLSKKIQGLLPKALTAGLSHAFTEKKEDEVSLYEKHKKQFGKGIIGMIIVSLIPFIVSLFFIYDSVETDIVINRIPRLVIAILPLYIPVLWLSVSSSKKMNLSKRLIEEYSHKEVLSKTFEGLSKQIEDVEENTISNDLKITLLENFLHVHSENPGKLISNYHASDHPIMELLEETNKLENSIEKLNKIPGIGKIVDILGKRKKEKLAKLNKKLNHSLNDEVADLEEDEEPDEDSIT